MSGIAGVFFDFGGTLFDYHPSNTAVWSQIAQRLGAEVALFDPRIREGMRRQTAAYVSLGKPFHKLSPEELHELNCHVLEAFGIDCEGTMDVINEEFGKRESGFISGEAFQIYPDALATLERISKMRHVRLGLISNCRAEAGKARRTLMRRTGIYRFFDAITLSGEVGVEKPDAAIFEIALKELGIKNVRNSVHVGDCVISDVHGGKNAGLIPVLYDPLELHSVEDVIVIRRLSDLIQYLV